VGDEVAVEIAILRGLYGRGEGELHVFGGHGESDYRRRNPFRVEVFFLRGFPG
jgi:hypothetical protein